VEEEEKELPTEVLVARCKPAVARVSGSRGGGTGFLAAPGVLVTNSHVVGHELTGQVKVSFPSAADAGKTPSTARLIYEDRKRDLAIFRLESEQAPSKLAGEYRFEGGEKVVVIGNPGASAGEHVILENAVTQGVMSVETTLNNYRFYQFNAAVNPGNSGGPVFDSRGQVIGVVTRKAVGKNQEGMGFAIPLADLREALAKAEAQDPKEVARVVSMHNAVVLFRRLAMKGVVHGIEMETCNEWITRHLRAGRPAQEGFNEGQRVLARDERYRQKKAETEALMKEIEPLIPDVLHDANLTDGTRQNLDRLVTTTSDMGAYIRNPRNAPTFRAKTVELISDWEKQVAALKTLTGVEDFD
jgi:hypothetical protein